MTTKDFSESTLKIYNEAINGNIAASDLIDVLIESDFNKKEIHSFIKKNFKSLYKIFLKNYINKL